MSFLPIPAEGELTPEAQAAAEAHLARFGGELGLADRALLAEPVAFEAYRGWHRLREEIVPYLGERAVDLYCYALTSALGARACAAGFRAGLAAGGDDPDAPQVTDAEQLLIDWGRAIGADPAAVPGELAERVEQTFQPRLRVLLSAFAGQTAALAVFTLAARLGGAE